MEKKEEMERKDGNGEREDGKLGGVWGWDWEWGKGGVAIPQTLQQLSVNLGNYWCKK